MRQIEISKRLQAFPPYLFAEIDKQKAELRDKGIAFIDISIGDPDIQTPRAVIDRLYAAAKSKENQKYSLDQGSVAFRQTIADWTKKRFNVSLKADGEILPLIGSKEGLVHFPLAFVDPGEYILVPSPGYPGYKSAARFVGAKIHEMPLLETNCFLPDFTKIPQRVCDKAKLMYLNYPNNPTSALAPMHFLKEAVKFCAKRGIILAYDNAYSEIYFDEPPRSILEIAGAKEIAIEFHSLSKTFCMTGFRVGWAAGSSHFVKALLKVKSNIDSGVFGAVQEAAAVALEKENVYVDKLRAVLKERRDYFTAGLRSKGFKHLYADSTFYVWAGIPPDFKSSIDFSKYLLLEKNIVATPGVGFGTYGEGFIRFALTVQTKVLKQAIEKLG